MTTIFQFFTKFSIKIIPLLGIVSIKLLAKSLFGGYVCCLKHWQYLSERVTKLQFSSNNHLHHLHTSLWYLSPCLMPGFAVQTRQRWISTISHKSWPWACWGPRQGQLKTYLRSTISGNHVKTHNCVIYHQRHLRMYFNDHHIIAPPQNAQRVQKKTKNELINIARQVY